MSRRVPPGGFFDGGGPSLRRLPTEPSFPQIRVSRRAVFWIVIAAIALLLLFLLKPFATFYTDYLWFHALGYGSVFGTRFVAQIVSFFVFAVLFWIIGASNILVALSTGGRRLSSIGIRQRLVTAPATVLALLVIFLLGLLFGRIGSGQWQTTLTFLNQKSFGITDPIWHKDVGFYVFTLPFYRFLWGWLLAVVILMTLAVAGLYASRAGLGLQTLTFPPRAARHLSVLGAAFMALLAVHYRLDLYELLLSKRNFVYGAGYTDVSARIPAYWIMVVLMSLIAIALLINAGRDSLAPLALAIPLWLGAAFILLVVFPGVVQRFGVAPNEQSRETPYIKNEIAFTRQAYGLAAITDRPFTPRDTITADAVARNPQTVQNARLWDPQLALPLALENQQSLRTYYSIFDVAVDRYQLGGQYLQLLLAARELDTAGLSAAAQNWVNLKLQYTHGYGVVAARANQATPEGDPVLTLKNIPPVGLPAVTQGAIYFGRHATDYVLVDSNQAELDYLAETTHLTHWQGTTGVQLSSALRKLAFAVRFGDINVLISPPLTSQTKVLFNRAVQDRVATLAPFLQFDQDPYVVVVDGKLYWILDGFTTSDHYPYSRMPPDSTGTLAGANYIRNSVKVVVDAYDGSTTFYQIDPHDPIINTYGSLFPGLLKPFGAMPAGLQAHIRYPRDLFNIQAEMYQTYHVDDPNTFYTREDQWQIAKETQDQTTGPAALRPFYVIMRLPGEPKEEFVTILPYTPNGKTNMIAYLAARSDQPGYGTLFDFRFPKDSLVVGPQQVESNIDQAPAIKSQFALLNAPGSKVIRGNLLVLPIESSLLYIEPVYLQAANVAKPQLKKVIVATGQNVAMENTLDQALASLLGVAAPSTPTGPTTGPAISGTAAQLITQAKQHYDTAQKDLAAGDFVGYATEIKTVGALLNQLAALQPAPSPGASPSASASASP
ncbi:MAG: UPF0182 family protein [Candidatus Dormibacteraeota bacterium]|nr:UPF0182 family protein [Candidatus Dormibacteraeota bacterium]